MLSLKNKIICENIFMNINFRYWISAVFLITGGSFFDGKKIIWKLQFHLVKKKWMFFGILFNKYVKSSQILNSHWNFKQCFSKKQIFVIVTANLYETDKYKDLKKLNWIFFNLIVFHIVLDCLNLTSKFLLWIHLMIDLFLSTGNLTHY